jgi:broad specificity phosphatase PhoE
VATTLFLVRHAAHDRVGSTLCGRMPGVTLGDHGRRQAAALAGRMERESITAVYSSPLERARETAAPIAARLGLVPRIAEGAVEIDFGAWTGRGFASLDGDPSWERWNAARATARTPGGESMTEAQSRAVNAMVRLHRDHPEERVVVVSHCDVIKAVLAHYLAISLDGLQRFDVAPASVSTLAVWDGGGKVLGMNEVVAA